MPSKLARVRSDASDLPARSGGGYRTRGIAPSSASAPVLKPRLAARDLRRRVISSKPRGNVGDEADLVAGVPPPVIPRFNPP